MKKIIVWSTLQEASDFGKKLNIVARWAFEAFLKPVLLIDK